LTLKEVGLRLGVTREWVRKIEIRAVQKLDDGWDSGSDSVKLRQGGAGRRTRPPGTAPSPSRRPSRSNPAAAHSTRMA